VAAPKTINRECDHLRSWNGRSSAGCAWWRRSTAAPRTGNVTITGNTHHWCAPDRHLHHGTPRHTQAQTRQPHPGQQGWSVTTVVTNGYLIYRPLDLEPSRSRGQHGSTAERGQSAEGKSTLDSQSVGPNRHQTLRWPAKYGRRIPSGRAVSTSGVTDRRDGPCESAKQCGGVTRAGLVRSASRIHDNTFYRARRCWFDGGGNTGPRFSLQKQSQGHRTQL